ncbi:MAG: hypothetical protein H0U42_05040 [Thermoleophilaceae bacterium]|nr:hypothetical protein [Thermoleophilaceae bacterium]
MLYLGGGIAELAGETAHNQGEIEVGAELHEDFRTVGSTDHDQEQAGSVNNWTCAGIDPQD